MQIKIFPVDAKEEEVNKFLDSHDLLENGVIVRDSQIIVRYVKNMTDEERKRLKLERTLNIFLDQYVEAAINYEFYLALEKAGKGAMEITRDVQGPIGPQTMRSTVSKELSTAKVGKESIKAQIVVLREMIANPPKVEEEPSVFGKKIYKPKP